MDTLIKVENLRVSYPVAGGLFGRGGGVVNAVDGVSFEISRGEIVGLVGESGSGKTTTGRAIIRLAPVSGGSVFYFNGKDKTDLAALSKREFFPFRKKIQMVFQDPFNSLDPRMTVFKILCEPLDIYFKLDKKAKLKRAEELMELVGLEPSHLFRFPHEFSGGQRQRIGIARALAVEPEFIICDEPVSALDVSVQAQIINLISDLRSKLNLTCLFIAHDIAVVEHISSRMMVMTEGKIVESGVSSELCSNPRHPYTRRLIDAVPKF